MAVQAPTKVLFAASDPSYKEVLLAFDNVTTGDTYDLAGQGFAKVFGAIFLSKTERTQTPVVSVITSSTIATFSTTGLANDGGSLYAVGV